MDEVSLAHPGEVSTLGLEYQNFFSGPPLVSARPDASGGGIADVSVPGGARRPIVLTQQLSGQYRFESGMSLSAVTVWNRSPQGSAGLDPLDPYVRFATGPLLERSGLQYSADFRISAPVSRTSRANGLLTALASEHSVSYQPGGSRWTVTMTAFFQKEVSVRRGSDEDHPAFEFNVSPEARYRLSDRLEASLLYASDESHATDNSLEVHYEEGPALQPGIHWRFVRNAVLRPFLIIPTRSHPSLETTRMGAQLNWELL